MLTLEERKQAQRRTIFIICAHNEERNLSRLLPALAGLDVLVVDDGSDDETYEIVKRHGFKCVRHGRRLGKQRALRTALEFALKNEYDVVVEFGADSILSRQALEKIIDLASREVDAFSVRQMVLKTSRTYYVERIIWGVLAEAKELQMKWYGSCYIGGIAYGFKASLLSHGLPDYSSVNDDEALDQIIKDSGARVMFVPDATVYFDCSMNFRHLLFRRLRMLVGHHQRRGKTDAPSNDPRLVAVAFLKLLMKEPYLIPFALPAALIEISCRLLASRIKDSGRFLRWPRPDSSGRLRW